jgi:pilus assembly protein Flp/PilA
MLAYLRKSTRDARDRGASAVEYGLLVAAIAAVIVGLVFGIGTVVRDAFSQTCNALNAHDAQAPNNNCPAP